MQALRDHPRTLEATFGMCRFGLLSPGNTPIKKHTRILSNLKPLHQHAEWVLLPLPHKAQGHRGRGAWHQSVYSSRDIPRGALQGDLGGDPGAEAARCAVTGITSVILFRCHEDETQALRLQILSGWAQTSHLSSSHHSSGSEIGRIPRKPAELKSRRTGGDPAPPSSPR